MLGALAFLGAGGNDTLTKDAAAELAEIFFSREEGADLFSNHRIVIGLLEFMGGAGDDLLTNDVGAELVEVLFTGDAGADLFENTAHARARYNARGRLCEIASPRGE